MPIYVLEKHVCDGCRLLDEDHELKECGYCGMCDSWICNEDQPRWGRRLRAAIKRKLEFNYKGVPEYEKLIEQSGRVDGESA